MCGIAGFFSESDFGSDFVRVLEPMLTSIEHRGPDHQGVFQQDNIAMGNQRLKVIDLEGGNQPMHSYCGRYVCVYNGEIYNYRKLRKLLISRGATFKTKSDTEVFINGFSAFGLDFFPMLDGMFAACIYDKTSKEVFLVRDRLGIKPLYYSEVEDSIVFASEIKSILKYSDTFDDLDFKALSMYLHQGFIPQPWTAFSKIKRLPAGHYLHFDGSLNLMEYFELDFTRKEDISKNEASEELEGCVSKAVKYQVHSDVPVGVFLSGGYDSSLVLSMLHKNGVRPKTYTLAFGDPEYDESGVAEGLANFLNFSSEVVRMDEDQLIRCFSERSEHYAEPLYPWINSGRSFLAEHVRNDGVNVVLNGAGGDELFCGYQTLNALKLSGMIRPFVKKPSNSILSGIVNRLPAGEGVLPFSYKAKAFLNAIDSDPLRTFFNFKNPLVGVDLKMIFSEDFVAKLAEHDPFEMFSQYHGRISDWNIIDQAQYLDMKCFLEGAILCLGDNATMAKSVEERVPLLGNEVVDFALKLPLKTKFEMGSVKPIVKSSVQNYLARNGSHALAKGFSKRGFDLPGNKWMKSGSWGEYIGDHVLGEDRLINMGIFKPAGVRDIVLRHKRGETNFERAIQVITGFVEFFDRYGK